MRPQRNTTYPELITALKRVIDEDGYLELDRHQAQYLVFLLEDLAKGEDTKFAIMDLIGSLPDAPEEAL